MTVGNIARAIYYKQEEPFYIYRFSWIEPIARMFHFQMNILKLFLATFWGQFEDKFLLQCLITALKQVAVSLKNTCKEFHICDNLFQTVIQANVIAFCITRPGYASIALFGFGSLIITCRYC